MKQILLALVLLFSSGSFASAADNTALLKELVRIYQDNLVALQAKDLGKVIATFHPESPSFNNAKAAAAQSMVSYDLSYKLSGADFVGVSREYAVVRIVQETRRLAGDDKFQDNAMDVLQVFKQDKTGAWKLWSSSVLTVSPLK